MSTLSRADRNSQTPCRRLDAHAAADAAGLSVAPASILLEAASGRVLACGRPADVDRHPAAAGGGVSREAFPGSVLIPGLVNAHAHLDLTHLGPREHDPGRGFVAWIDMIRTGRCHAPADIRASAERGAALALAGGTVAVGDIAGCTRGQHTLEPQRAMAAAGLAGVSFIETFGIGPRRAESAARLAEFLDRSRDDIAAAAAGPVRVGLQPHAPNTCTLDHYRFCIGLAGSGGRNEQRTANSEHFRYSEQRTASSEHARGKPGLPLCTHLAETLEERLFVEQGAGPQREMLERLGLWDDAILQDVGRGQGPVQHLAPILAEARFLVAHVNDADDAAIETLAGTRAAVAYCPRASAYFHAERRFGPHRYRDMLAAGIAVALGTDSIVNLPPEAADPARGGISILDEMRLLHRRDGTDPALLLRMATLNGAAALGLDPSGLLLAEGAAPLGIVAIEAPGPSRAPLEAALRSGAPARLVYRRNSPAAKGLASPPPAPPAPAV